MTFFRSFAMCFSMYSRIPMPRVDWEKGGMKYVFCFFPLIGALIGGLELGWYFLAGLWGVHTVLYAAAAALIPVLVTGGIHLDGYLDTCDALFSYGDKEKKLEIMKDPRAGAFAVIYCGVYLLACFGMFAQLFQNASLERVGLVAIGYLLSRCICGLCTVSVPCARSSGLAHMFQDGADKRRVRVALSLWGIGCIGVMAWLSLWNFILIACMLALAVLLFIHTCKRQFEGITGDLAGFILQISELLILGGALFLI